MRRRPPVAAALALAVLAAGCDAIRRGPPQVGDVAPAYAARTLDGRPVSLEALRGQTVLLNVWATWCHPCREELPDLQRLHVANGGRGLRLVGVSIDEAGMADAIREFAVEYGVTSDVWHDPGSDVASIFGTVGVPSTFLIAPDGTLLWKHVGPVKADDPELTRLLERSLARRS
jgi:cytochrome c biogenesis protein CcmG/thiol:disulfide interchange protein DsbE